MTYRETEVARLAGELVSTMVAGVVVLALGMGHSTLGVVAVKGAWFLGGELGPRVWARGRGRASAPARQKTRTEKLAGWVGLAVGLLSVYVLSLSFPIISFLTEEDIVPFDWVVGNLVLVVLGSSVVATLVSITLAGPTPSEAPAPGSGQAGR